MLYFVLATFMVIINAVNGSIKCSVLEPCKAICDGTVLDLSVILGNDLPLQITDFGNGNKSEESGFFISPCEGHPCGRNSPTYSAVCQETIFKLVSCGLINETTWYLETTDPYRYTIVFAGGNNGRQSTIKFIEDLSISEINLTYVSSHYPTDNNYEFIIKGSCIRPGSCLKASNKEPIGMIGFALISILGVCVLLYLSIGIIVMKTRGAKRFELIPHYQFWKDLPLLVADGCLFITSPCCCWKYEPTVASYHEIPAANTNI